jgi:hypothetical protein
VGIIFLRKSWEVQFDDSRSLDDLITLKVVIHYEIKLKELLFISGGKGLIPARQIVFSKSDAIAN